MMRHNRISKLLLLLIIPSLLGVIFTCIFRGYTANWIQILCYSFAPLVSSIIVAICFRWDYCFYGRLWLPLHLMCLCKTGCSILPMI